MGPVKRMKQENYYYAVPCGSWDCKTAETEKPSLYVLKRFVKLYDESEVI